MNTITLPIADVAKLVSVAREVLNSPNDQGEPRP